MTRMPSAGPLRSGGRYEGRCAVTFLDDGRRVQLLEAFSYVDCDELRWFVPARAIVDGASIPRALWSLVGGPFEGRYREASVIHDWYCDRRNRPWHAVHRVFYEAMRTSGVDRLQAKVMYAAVYAGGPRWSETVVANNRLDVPRNRAADGLGITRGDATPPPSTSDQELEAAGLATIAAWVRAHDPNLDQIDAFVERQS